MSDPEYYDDEIPEFDSYEKKFISSLIPNLDFEKLSDDEYVLIVDAVSGEYGGVCQDDPIQDIEKCLICESILDKLGDSGVLERLLSRYKDEHKSE